VTAPAPHSEPVTYVTEIAVPPPVTVLHHLLVHMKEPEPEPEAEL
jgi:hypothetical protein